MTTRRATAAAALVLALGWVATPALGADHATPVAIASYAYQPDHLTVHQGEAVTWTNEDSAPHTVTSASGPTTLSSPQLAKGQSWTFRASVPGTYHYYCAVHPDMKAALTVLPAAPTPTQTASPAPVPTRRARARVSSSLAPTAAPTSAPVTTATLAPTTTASSGPRPRTLDPTLLLVSLTAGAVVLAVLALGRRVTRTSR